MQSIDDADGSEARNAQLYAQIDAMDYVTGPREINPSAYSSNSSYAQEVSADSLMAVEQSAPNQRRKTSSSQHGYTEASEMSREQIKVLHFAQQSQSAESLLENDIIFIGNNEPNANVARSEVKEGLSNGILTGTLNIPNSSQNPNSLTNSFKKSQANTSQQNSESRTRSFSDVLKAMRDTEELEEEKRMMQLQTSRT